MPRDPLPPILLSEVRAAGLVLRIGCGHPDCFHEAEIPAGEIALPSSLDLNQIGHRLYGMRAARRQQRLSDHKGWVRHLRATGQRERLPWFAVMMPEDS